MLRSSATATVKRSTWQEVEDRLREKKLGLDGATTFDTYKAIGKIGQWHLTALNEKDQFRRFMWSYIGLEIIVDTVSRIGRADLTEMLASTSTLGPATIVELLWPQDVRDTDPNRSLRFKFAVCAAVLSPETASADVEIFAEINKYRNSIHGRLLPSMDPPSPQAFGLFERYSRLASDYLGQN
jgi:hypothetical protein